MSEAATPTPTEHEVNVRHHVYRILDQHLDRAFEELDHLHKRGITDTDVITAMRHGGYRSEADAYIEWAGANDPDLADVNNETMNPVVPDPSDAPSYAEHPLNVKVQTLHVPTDGTVKGLREVLDLFPVDCEVELQTGAEQFGTPSYVRWDERTNKVVLG